MAVLTINGTEHQLEVDGDMPLLVIRDSRADRHQVRRRMAPCGACTVHLDGDPRCAPA